MIAAAEFYRRHSLLLQASVAFVLAMVVVHAAMK